MSRLFAAVYDFAVAHAERGGVASWRSSLLGALGGVILDAGAGTGANLDAFSPNATHILLAEPDEAMRVRLERRVRTIDDPRLEVIDSPFEQLALSDHSVDVVVSTLVLCTVEDPAAALREARRVLRPGGRLAFIEHVAAEPGTRRAQLQRFFQPIWGPLAGGCHLTRDTEQAIRDAGFRFEQIEHGEIATPFPLIRPSIRGIAVSD